MDPRTSPPSGSADTVMGGGSTQAVMSIHPAEATSTGTFAIQLFNPGSPTPEQPIGWLGRDSANWAILVTDQANRLRLEAYINGDKTYYKIPDEARYMSVSNNAYIGFYGWSGASTFHQNGDFLISDHNGQALSYYSPENGYLYCYDDYTRLKVKFVNT